jgi:hypothetical protein
MLSEAKHLSLLVWLSLGKDVRFFAKPVLSRVEGLRMTPKE